MKLQRATLLGLYAVLELADQPEQQLSRTEIADKFNLSSNHLSKVMRELGKAGAVRWRGVRPTVRGVAMNPVDHPHGGGEGRTSGGRHPVTPWGVPTKGYRTRTNKRTTKMIVRSRHKK